MEQRRVLVAGAGVAGLETALALRELARDLVSVELVAPEAEFVYRPLAVAEPFGVGEVRRFPLEPLVEAAGARLRCGALAAVDTARSSVTLEDGSELPYDVLVLAVGAQPSEAIAGALTFRGPQDGPSVAALLERATSGQVKRIVFALPAAATWPLPLYELAFLTTEYLVDHLTRDVEILLVTPESRPLAMFGQAASDAMTQLLEIRDIEVQVGATGSSWADGALELDDGTQIAADAVVALPKLTGPPISGLYQDADGFVPTDEAGRVEGVPDLYAIGDLSRSPVKQGGIAAQQADAAAAAIALDAGATDVPPPSAPVLRGLLLTGLAPRFLRTEEGASTVDTQPLWWPPAKVVGRYLSPFLADHLGLAADVHEPHDMAGVPVEVAIDTRDHAGWSSV